MGDLTVAAVPFYFASMAAEAWHHHRRAERTGTTTPGDYTPADTAASLTMGVASLVAPFVLPRMVQRLNLTRRSRRRLVIGAAGAAAAATVVADVCARMADERSDQPRVERSSGGSLARAARRISGTTAVAAIAGAGASICGTLAAQTTGRRLFARRPGPDLGTGPLAWAVAMVGWDFIYYWNHRFMHSSRYMWAIHVVHHSSERYNLSTALRQPVADALGTFVPYGLLALAGVRPEIIQQARALNLVYQFWIHTDAIDRIGPFERWLNSPSHHRVHHGSNLRYIDRNHGGILIIWDRLFGTFAEEDPDEPVVYGLTTNIDTYNPMRIATHEYAAMIDDVAHSDNWGDRLSYVVRGPGWAYARHRASDDQEPTGSAATANLPELAAAANAL